MRENGGGKGHAPAPAGFAERVAQALALVALVGGAEVVALRRGPVPGHLGESDPIHPVAD